VGLYNYDIDPVVKTFYDSIRDYDKHVISSWTSNKKMWNLSCCGAIKAKYFTALKRRERDDDPYLIIKLITNNNNEILTSVTSKEKKDMKAADIAYGTNVDQYICPKFVLFNESGIHPIWQAHQVVVSPIERIFLDNCLLDVLSPQLLLAPVPPLPPPLHHRAPQRTEIQARPPQTASPFLGRIKKEELLSAIGRLKSSSASSQSVPKGERSKITDEELQEQRESIKHNAKKTIMLESIKDMPVEGAEGDE
jgi:hypothetical protein